MISDVLACLDTQEMGEIFATEVSVVNACFCFVASCMYLCFSLLVPPDQIQPVLVGCSQNDDCPDFAACRNRACVNPCAEDKPCAPNANCRVTRHEPVCTCPDGYIGSPEIECKLRKFAIYCSYLCKI